MVVRMLKRLFQNQANRDKDTLRIAQTLVTRGEIALAQDELGALLARSPENASALFLRGALKRMQKDAQGGRVDVERALALGLGEDTAGGYVELAQCWQAIGDSKRAVSSCEQARALDPESVPAFFLLAQLQLPGDHYFDVLARIIGHVKPRTYVEIGVFQGASLKLAQSAKAVVGIDPAPKIAWSLEPHMKVFPMTSDAFFAAHDLGAELGNRKVDLAFIDGMHQFEFAMRDFANLERYCSPESVILVHDCYPVDAESAGREPRDTRWSGDVWRLIVLLKKYRPDLQIHTIGTAPTGLAVIQNLDPLSTYLMDNHDRLCEELVALDYSYLEEDKPAKLNLFPNHPGQIKAMIRQRSR